MSPIFLPPFYPHVPFSSITYRESGGKDFRHLSHDVIEDSPTKAYSYLSSYPAYCKETSVGRMLHTEPNTVHLSKSPSRVLPSICLQGLSKLYSGPTCARHYNRCIMYIPSMGDRLVFLFSFFRYG